MGPKNRGLHKKLDITPTKPCFENPSIPGEKVFCFADTPHLLEKYCIIKYCNIWNTKLSIK